MNIPEFVLASASPARHRLLQTVGIEPIIYPSDFDESQVQLSNPQELVNKLAQCKAETVSPRFPAALIMGCDSVLAMDNQIYGKPENVEVAISRWRLMQGNWGDLYTGHVLMDKLQKKTIIKCQITRVYFAKMTDHAIINYVRTGEPLKCAGGFALEGFGSLFVEKIMGCHSNVIGLSLPLLRQMLGELGYEVTDFWQ
ncbi:septum formation inhibitor Maf [Cylindrospermopsis raciborskii S07]|uniref:Nucleoside triphosphate pyrophosphatase n=1 Tax=Cylindrospermopsis raciborskii CS-505 TaxID=533240 RepID=A0A853MCB5_9CYAN|nr:nucleoside triphosphate pyrophosphatase [Cylindrospermopsis raciborskii]EFA70960.1 Maf-like protein [Cylindrospermopsis raciborskii CS-505]OBU75124.1 septum formation inhibitor Maf [Cylindrospermopsis raciborskii CS-505]PNK02507.1 septum formation inhibitor Maf [Cylindrospermopsis raciborskii S07]PNK05951.1 septum formation inhibitor Maf [Cylindrospermopsis raciborskii S14]PNK07503.1 septum formation inhibitor Maf [Cylindrospermopsis raciborskii S10]